MKEAVLVRESSTDQGTYGVLSCAGVTFHTLELPWRDNKRQRSCIPVGEYVCQRVNSPRFGRVFHVNNVPGRSAILIHSGNFAGDVDMGYASHVQGCILLGMARGKMRDLSGSPQRAVLLSKPAVRKFMELVGEGPFLLQVKE
jgi:hypothetical protein